MVLQVIDGGSEIGVLQATSEEDCQSGGNRNLDILVGKLALCRSLVTGFFLARRTFFSLVNAAVYDHGSVWAMDFFLTVQLVLLETWIVVEQLASDFGFGEDGLCLCQKSFPIPTPQPIETDLAQLACHWYS